MCIRDRSCLYSRIIFKCFLGIHVLKRDWYTTFGKPGSARQRITRISFLATGESVSPLRILRSESANLWLSLIMGLSAILEWTTDLATKEHYHWNSDLRKLPQRALATTSSKSNSADTAVETALVQLYAFGRRSLGRHESNLSNIWYPNMQST